MPHAGLTLRVAAVLFAFWLLFSGKFDVVHVGAGVLTALGIAYATAPLRCLDPVIGQSRARPFGGIRWGSALGFAFFLGKEIVASSLQVAYVVLHPRMPIEPRVMRFQADLPHPLARLTLANAITLTPGTVTLDVDGEHFVVHALTAASANGVATGVMQHRVSHIFGGSGTPARIEEA